ncbi:DUF4342 domain-containing protein [candidate division KSB3 bacterium]|uniref:DUF4342 domain-containing protein n=1 Tax=candidate division KSB3 bacterium TaxID=2044937 RepID=A0A9D5K0Q1_9BACT|nr:DUF4342 domain-containing protein [candidate division KSB3 bacterium]MBD3327655.1 DUF4342 domain-containing protein [candidate division KSB3 bacterium]
MKRRHVWSEELEVAAHELVGRVKEIVKEGNVRRVIVRKPNDDPLLDIPLTAGVAVGGAVTIIAPYLTVLGVIAGLLVNVKVQVIRTAEQEDDAADSPTDDTGDSDR